ncbi:MAG TPA: hypothetical protein VGQ09_07985 [Chitinophagaceae bacterium]|nr:hypothetical protein [Chitinophagaceae bacterium]
MSESYEKKITDSPPAKTDVNKSNSLIKEWKYLGQYKKNILLIVRYNASPHLPDEPLNFLTSVLGACKLSLADIAVLNIAMAPSVLYKDVQEQFKAGVTILFGLTPEEFEMPVNFPEFQVQAFNHCHFLHTPTLEELESDKILKSKLWVCLKRMFSLS